VVITLQATHHHRSGYHEYT